MLQKSFNVFEKIQEGKIRKHNLDVLGKLPTQEDELIESQLFKKFLVSLNGCRVYNLKGHDNLVK